MQQQHLSSLELESITMWCVAGIVQFAIICNMMCAAIVADVWLFNNLTWYARLLSLFCCADDGCICHPSSVRFERRQRQRNSPNTKQSAERERVRRPPKSTERTIKRETIVHLMDMYLYSRAAAQLLRKLSCLVHRLARTFEIVNNEWWVYI